MLFSESEEMSYKEDKQELQAFTPSSLRLDHYVNQNYIIWVSFGNITSIYIMYNANEWKSTCNVSFFVRILHIWNHTHWWQEVGIANNTVQSMNLTSNQNKPRNWTKIKGG